MEATNSSPTNKLDNSINQTYINRQINSQKETINSTKNINNENITADNEKNKKKLKNRSKIKNRTKKPNSQKIIENDINSSYCKLKEDKKKPILSLSDLETAMQEAIDCGDPTSVVSMMKTSYEKLNKKRFEPILSSIVEFIAKSGFRVIFEVKKRI